MENNSGHSQFSKDILHTFNSDAFEMIKAESMGDGHDWWGQRGWKGGTVTSGSKEQRDLVKLIRRGWYLSQLSPSRCRRAGECKKHLTGGCSYGVWQSWKGTQFS